MPRRSQNLYLNKYKNPLPISDDEDEENNLDGKKLNTSIKCRRRHELDNVSRVLINNTREAQELVVHSQIPGFNQCLLPPKTVKEYRQYPSCEFSVPMPVHVTNAQSTLNDICLQRPKVYESWRRNLLHLKTRYDKAPKTIPRNLNKDHMYHTSVYDFAEHLMMNPDPYFCGSYDYYYTGGNMAVLPLTSALMVTPLVLHTLGNNLREFAISKFLPNRPSQKLAEIHRSELTAPSEVFQVHSLNCYQVNRGNVFTLRQRDSISLHQILLGEPPDDSDSESCSSDEVAVKKSINGKTTTPNRPIDNYNGNDGDNGIEPGEIKVEMLTEFKSNTTPFISFAQPKAEATKLLISNMKQAVRIYDLGRDSPEMSCMYRLSQDDRISWNTLLAWKDETVFYANDRYLCPMDLRTKPDQWLSGTVSAESPMYHGCDMISALSLSRDNLQRLYVATAHKLHCLDVRFMTGSFEGKGSIATWTHQLQYAPSLIDTYATADNVEFVALSSLMAGDLHICELSPVEHTDYEKAPSGNHYTTFTMPYQPPTLEEAYQSAREANNCLYPLANVQQRISRCTTGLAFYDMAKWSGVRSANDDVCAYLMTANSVGDVFVQSLTSRTHQESETRTGRHTDEIVVDYETCINEQVKLPLKYSEMHDLKCLRKVFVCEQLSVSTVKATFGIQDGDDDDVKVPQHLLDVKPTRRCHRWKKSYRTLSNFKDYLVDDLLAVWDISPEDIERGIPANIDKQLATDTKPKIEQINDWLSRQELQKPQAVAQTDLNCAAITAKQENITPYKSNTIENVLPNGSLVSVHIANLSQIELDASYHMDFSQDVAAQPLSSTQINSEMYEYGYQSSFMRNDLMSGENGGAYGNADQTITISEPLSRKRKRLPANKARRGF